MHKRILLPGRNCWRVTSGRAAVLIDAANYFAWLERALARAERSILVVGWDFDGRIRLCPEREGCPPLGDFLRQLVEARPALEVRILVWSVAVIHAPGAPMPLLLGAPWQDHPRITQRLDSHHPIYAAHHQKLVSIDDSLAFAGGIDLTVRRWDTCDHGVAAKGRVEPDGAAYEPVHDLQMVVNGEAARALAETARERWRRATGEVLAPGDPAADRWPDGLKPDFTDAPIGIARTVPEYGDDQPVREIAALSEDVLWAARRSIYIEAQYLTDPRVGTVLVRRLEEPDGPEVVIVLTRNSHGLMEQFVMGHNRDRLLRRLRRADMHGRLRVFHPAVPGKNGDCDVLVHAKLLVVDDALLRVGSSNLNNRSRGLDTECDLAIEASSPSAVEAIARLRAELLGEHLGVPADAVMAAISETGSLVRAIDRLNRNPRALRPLSDPHPDGPTAPIAMTWLLDPARPFEPLWWRRRKRARSARGRDVRSLPG